MLLLAGLLFSVSDLVHAQNGYPQTLYEDNIFPNESGGNHAYFENKEYEIKVVAAENESYVLRLWDVNALFDEPYGKYILESEASSSTSWKFTFPHRGFYAIEIVNDSGTTNEFILSFVRHKGIQEDFQLHSMAIAIAGAILMIIGLMVKEEEK